MSDMLDIIEQGDAEALISLLKKCHDDDEPIRALFSVIDRNKIEIVKHLLKYEKTDINKLHQHYIYKETELFLAIENNNIEIVKLLLYNEKIDVDQYFFQRSQILVLDNRISNRVNIRIHV
ncbi:hypothetical protein M9Y10_029422 [Tritrichomonas musculus]|uniref:Ankyrin repeat protein n=1 Tax=Tritrichomonas musculus TaxID=1915356 RepID=A0ABR2KM37_9EUKA